MTSYLILRCKIMVAPISTNRLCRQILRVRKEELLALIADANSYYTPYQQKRIRADRTLKIRDIEPSVGYLKTIQKRIDRFVLKPVIETLPVEIMGGRKGVSVMQNARYHANSKGLMKYDVKTFFPSIKYSHVYYIFRYRLGFCEEAANILTKLTTYPEESGHVPQGAPTSTSLAMLALEPLCTKLKLYSDANNMKFSIWVDDITVSGSPETLKTHRGHIGHLINATPFTIHPDKNSGVLQKGSKTEHEKGRRVTGITIDNSNRLTLGRAKLKSLRRRVKKATVASDSLRGSLQFLRHVNPSQGKSLYHSYLSKVDATQKRKH